MMSLIQARSVLAACFFIVTPTGLAGAETQIWTEKASEGMITLAYGPVDSSQHPTLLLSCFNEMGVAALEIFGVIEGTRPGEKLAIEFSAGTSHTVDGVVELDDKTGGMYAEASGFEVKPLLAVLMSEGPVKVSMAATNLALTDAGRADAAEKFGQDCKLD